MSVDAADSFGVSTRVVIGDGLAGVLLGRKRIFIVTDSFMARDENIKYVTDRIQPGSGYSVFSDVASDPDINTVAAGICMMLDYNPDVVVCYGGGSPIDAAKAIVYFARKITQSPKMPFVAVPTTSGTGSEVSKFAVITDRERQIKYPLVDDSLLPDAAVLDASLTVSVPPAITADTGMDVLTHAIEAFVSKGANDFSSASAEAAIKLVAKHLNTAYKEPDNLKARQGMHNASCLAGIAFSNAGLGICHSMAHALGARFHIPHGRTNAILLPYVMSFNAGCADQLTQTAKAYARISRLIGLEAANVRQSALNLVRMVRRYTKKLSIPSSIMEAGVDRREFMEALDDLSEAAFADKCTATNPRECTREDIALIFTKAYNGKLP